MISEVLISGVHFLPPVSVRGSTRISFIGPADCNHCSCSLPSPAHRSFYHSSRSLLESGGLPFFYGGIPFFFYSSRSLIESGAPPAPLAATSTFTFRDTPSSCAHNKQKHSCNNDILFSEPGEFRLISAQALKQSVVTVAVVTVCWSSESSAALTITSRTLAFFGRGDDTVGNPHRAQISLEFLNSSFSSLSSCLN